MRLILNPNDMITFNLRAIFRMRGISYPRTVLMNAGIPERTATNLLNNTFNSIKIEYLEILCTVLNCEPNDLMVWTANKGVVYAEDFPLKRLVKRKEEELAELIAVLPMDKLRVIAGKVVDGDGMNEWVNE